jgi:hypothetical protein
MEGGRREYRHWEIVGTDTYVVMLEGPSVDVSILPRALVLRTNLFIYDDIHTHTPLSCLLQHTIQAVLFILGRRPPEI